MEQTPYRHQQGGRHLKDVVYGANDGIITTFAIVAGVAGAGLDNIVVVLLGLANLLADGFSMAASNYLGSKSEHDFAMRERKTEEVELKETPKEERAEMFGYLRKKGYTKDDAESLVGLLVKKREFWLDVMMKEELGIYMGPTGNNPSRSAVITFFSFVGVGFIPLIPYFFASNGATFKIAIFCTAAALFTVGALRYRFTGQRWHIAGGEMLVVGGIAAVIAYGVGFFVKTIVG